MSRLVLAVAVFAGSLVAVTPQAPTVSPSEVAPKKRPEAPRTSRAHERVPIPHTPRRDRHAARPWVTVESTAYCSTGNRNAAGNWPTVGTAAANGYPLGTRLEVRGYGVVTVEDRSAIGATELDLYLGAGPSCEAAAVQWGRRYVEVREAA